VTSNSFRRSLFLLATSVVTTLSLVAPCQAQEQKAPERTEALPAAPPASPDVDYVIGPGDVLHLFIWKEPDLTRNVTVRLDGRITVPLIGEITAAGRSPASLAGEIRTALGRFIASPNVTVEVTQTSSAQFYVLGQVLKPGQFSMSGRVTVLQALALAGGFKEFAKTEEIVVVRHEGDSQTFLPFNYKRVQSARDPAQNLVLRPGDTILVP
jgi:polysaccharide export outer membrane protein